MRKQVNKKSLYKITPLIKASLAIAMFISSSILTTKNSFAATKSADTIRTASRNSSGLSISNTNEKQPDSVHKVLDASDDANGFFSTIAIGYEGSFWSINENDKSPNPILEYKTEGLQLYRIFGNAGYAKKSFFTVIYERPAVPTNNQEEMIRTNTTQEAGMEKYSAIATLAPFVESAFSNNSISNIALRKLLSVRFKYTKELFFGEATVLRNSEYIPKTAFIDYQKNTISGIKTLTKGDILTFKTEFKDNEISIPLFSFKTHDIRLGYYTSEWRRPSATDNIHIITPSGTVPVVYEAAYKSNGYLLAYETNDIGASGLNADISFRGGTGDSLKTAFDWSKLYNKKTEVQSTTFNISLWYNLYASSRNNGLALTIGGTYNTRKMSVDTVTESTTTDANGNTETKKDLKNEIVDTDSIKKLFVTLAYRF